MNKNEISDFGTLIEIFKDVFKNENQTPDNVHLETLLTNPDFIVFVVKLNGKVLGGSTTYVLQSYYHLKPLNTFMMIFRVYAHLTEP